MQTSDSGPSASSASGSSDDEAAHPLDSYIAKRQESNAGPKPRQPTKAAVSAPARQPTQAPARVPKPASKVLPIEDEEDFEAALENGEPSASGTTTSDSSDGGDTGGSSASSSGEESDDEAEDKGPAPAEPAIRKKIRPGGVTIIEEGQEGRFNPEMARLLRQPRYFDEDFEGSAKRCFKCGGAGHMARDCTNAAKLRACYLCAQYGHDGRDCPNQLCWKCQRPGHQSRDCPNVGHKRPRTWDEEDAPAVCPRCGREECPCAGYGDYARAEGGCTASYKKKDLEKIRCFVCGHRGHLGCAPVTAELAKPSCYNCGEGGHTAETCRKEQPVAVRAERSHDRGGGRYNSGHAQQYNSYQGRDIRRGEQYRDDQDRGGRQYDRGYDDGSYYRRNDGGGTHSYGGTYSHHGHRSQADTRWNQGGSSRGRDDYGGGDAYRFKAHSNRYDPLGNGEGEGLDAPSNFKDRFGKKRTRAHGSGGGGDGGTVGGRGGDKDRDSKNDAKKRRR